jgi:hypothetical protein
VVEFDRLPDVPVTVTVTVPVAAVLLAVSVSVLEAVAGLGLNDALTPPGKPEADKLTLPLKPFWGVIVTELVPLAPCKTLSLFGERKSVKLPLLFTVRAIVVVFVRRPAVPAMVTFTRPVAAVALAVSVKVLVLVALAGLKIAVTPLGRPDADKLMLLLKPFTGLTVIMLVPLLPCVMVKLLGDAESEKRGMGPPVGQLFTKFVAFTEPMPVAKSQPVVVP